MDCPAATDVNPGILNGSLSLPTQGMTVLLLSFAGILLATIFLLECFLLPSRRTTAASSSSSSKQTLAQELLTHVVITGGSSGIGLSVGKECLERGAKVITLLARNPEKLERAKDELEAHARSKEVSVSTHVRIVAVDVSNQAAIAQAAKDICTSETQPVPTALLNIAGTSSSAAFVDTDYAEFRRLMDINYLGSAYATRAFVPYMLEDSR
eukprot:jgi/Psemu1/57180/gm1.57180_g